jgi:hypothetical protein
MSKPEANPPAVNYEWKDNEPRAYFHKNFLILLVMNSWSMQTYEAIKYIDTQKNKEKKH